ncbi:MAG: hypothetical protein WDZ49_01145, partial [Litorilinea sp.]
MHYLTKTTYLHAIQCRKRLWLARHKPQHQTPTAPHDPANDPAGIDVNAEAFRQGQIVGRTARRHF